MRDLRKWRKSGFTFSYSSSFKGFGADQWYRCNWELISSGGKSQSTGEKHRSLRVESANMFLKNINVTFMYHCTRFIPLEYCQSTFVIATATLQSEFYTISEDPVVDWISFSNHDRDVGRRFETGFTRIFCVVSLSKVLNPHCSSVDHWCSLT